MRVRIIFRGLTLFTFERPSRGSAAGDNLGTLTAHLVNRQGHPGSHQHVPRIGIIGRDLPGGGREHVTYGLDPRGDVTLALADHGAASGVTADGSFLDYVPCLRDLHWADPVGFNPDFVISRVVIPVGRIRARDFVAWDWHGNQPVEVAYMETVHRGFAANEVVVDVGDDDDIDAHVPGRFLSIRSGNAEIPARLWPLSKGGEPPLNDVSVNEVEIQVTNFAPQRRRAVPWSLHYQWLFDAAGYPRRPETGGNPGYVNVEQYEAFLRAARQYDPAEWSLDLASTGTPGQPFPFVLDKLTPLARISRAAEPYVLEGPWPPPAGRGPGEGAAGDPSAATGGHGHDPWARPICPFGRE